MSTYTSEQLISKMREYRDDALNPKLMVEQRRRARGNLRTLIARYPEMAKANGIQAIYVDPRGSGNIAEPLTAREKKEFGLA
jgi:hypothetical protein